MVLILDGVKALAKPFKRLIVDRIAKYLKYINSYEENMTNLVNELRILSAKKLDLAAKVKRDEANQRVMTRETGNWLRSLIDLIERPEMRQLMKEERVAEIVVKMMERRVLKKLWKEDREIFDIVVDVVKKNSILQRVVDGEVVDPEENDDYKKIAKIASDVIKDIVDEFTEFIKGRDDAAVAVVKLLNNVDLQNVDIEKLRKDGDEMAMILSKAEGIIRKEVGHNQDDEDDLLTPKHDNNVVQPVNESSIKEKVKGLRKRMGRLTAFLDDENFKKGLPDAARLGLEVMNALSNSSGTENAVVENSKPHRYCGYCIVRFQVNRRHHDMSEMAVIMVEAINSAKTACPPEPLTRPVRDDELENIPGEFIEGLESRDEILQRILIALKNDQVNIVGIYGMGGSGKDRRTLVESIPRWMCEETFEKFTAISLMSGHGRDFSRLSGVKAPMLEILLLKGDISSTTLPSSFFKGMENLKVLSLSNIDFHLGLPESMGHLERLKTLQLHYCKLKDVKLIGKLINLLVLSLRGSSLEELAVEIGELYKLRLLDIEGCKGMKRFPTNTLSRLSNLEGLYMFNGFDDWASTNIQDDEGEDDEGEDDGASIDIQVNNREECNQASASELDKLSHLNVLEMDVSKTEQLLTVNNGRLIEQLGKFKICGRNVYGSREKLPVFRYILELNDIYPSPNSGLRAFLKKTECLVLRDCHRLTKNVVPELDEYGFKDLKYFKVEKCSTMKSVMRSSEENEAMTFANLEILELIDMRNLKMICDGKASVGIFSNLRRLKLNFLPSLQSGLSLTSSLLNLNEIYIGSCDLLKFVAYKEDATNETEVDMFPCLKSLYLRFVHCLSSVFGQSGNEVFALFNAESKYPSLESLELATNDTIKMLWSPACYVSGFQNLKTLHIEICSRLQSLGSPSIFAALVQLEELKISKCRSLQEVISKETDGDIILEKSINFPKLKHLSLEDSNQIESFYRGTSNLKFPNLKSLRLSVMKDFINFDGSENSTTLFSDKIEFPRLEELDVQCVSNDVLRLWNWSLSLMQGKSESGSNSLNPFPNLQILRLGQVNKLVSVPHSVSHKLTHLEVNKFNNIKSLISVSTVNGEAFCTYSQLPYLKNLTVCECESLEQLFDSEDDDVAMLLCERLIEIRLHSMPKLKILPLHLLKSIHSLSLDRLSWEYVFPADLFIKGKEQLQQLESLEIKSCDNMKVIIKDVLVGEGEESVYSFPHLKILKLQLLKITKFASKPNSGIQFPSLESIDMCCCDNMKSFWSGSFIAPKLKNVNLDSSDGIECFLSENGNEVQELPSLERVEITGCQNLMSFYSQHLVAPKLRQVDLAFCPMKWFSGGDPNNNGILELPSLDAVSIIGCYGMKYFSSGGVHAPKLCELVIKNKEYSKWTNEEMHYVLADLPNFCG